MEKNAESPDNKHKKMGPKGGISSMTDNIRRAEKQTSGQKKGVPGLEDRGFGPMCVQSGR